MQSSSGSQGGGETAHTGAPGLPCPRPAAPGLVVPAARGILLSGRPGHRSPPRPRSAHGALGVLAHGAGGEVAATKVREFPLGLSGPVHPVSRIGPADSGFLTASLPRQHPRGRRPPRRHQALVDRRSPGPVRKPQSPTQESVCSPSPSAASLLPARLRRDGARHLPQTGQGPALRAPSCVLPGLRSRAPSATPRRSSWRRARSTERGEEPPATPRRLRAQFRCHRHLLETCFSLGRRRLLPAAALAMARSSDPRPDRFWRHASLWEGQTPSRKDGEPGTDSKLTRALSPAVTRNQRRS